MAVLAHDGRHVANATPRGRGTRTPEVTAVPPEGQPERQMADPAACYRASELAPLLGIPRLRLYELARRHEIPHKRIGRLLLFPKQSVQRWLCEPVDSADSAEATH